MRLHTLGRFRVEVNGEPLRFAFRAHRKPLQLLKVLVALGGERVPETQLSDALWPDADGDQAHASFATTLHRLRKLLGAEVLDLRDRRLSLDGEQCWVDTAAFERALRQAVAATSAGDEASPRLLEEALALYRGPFLEGEFEPPEILPSRERLHGLFLRQVDEAGHRLLESGRTPGAIALYRRALEIDPASEHLTRGLMRGLLAGGEAAEGLVAYRRLRDLLRSTLDVAPAPETEVLHQALLAAEPGADPEPTPAHRPQAGAGWLRGRRAVVATVGVAVVAFLVGGGLLWRAESARTEAAVAEFSRSVAFPLPDRPSIAVLPFLNLSDDPKQAYFSDGLSNDLITALAKLPRMFVIARQSSFRYRGENRDIRQVGRELGVRYVLDGSVQRTQARLRVNVQLVDAATGRHLWAEKYDHTSGDLFATIDEIVRQVRTELQVRLTSGGIARYTVKDRPVPQALDAYYKAVEEFERFSRDANALAAGHYRQAMDLDPRFARAVAGLGWTHMAAALFRWAPDRRAAVRKAAGLARRAIEMDDTDATAHALSSYVHLMSRRYDDAIAEARLAVRSEPSSGNAHFQLGQVLRFAGRPGESIAEYDRALRLNPYPFTYILHGAGIANYQAGRYDTAVRMFERVIARREGGSMEQRAYVWIIGCYLRSNREPQARVVLQRLLKHFPDFSLRKHEHMSRALPYRDPALMKDEIALLRGAGLPE